MIEIRVVYTYARDEGVGCFIPMPEIRVFYTYDKDEGVWD